MSLKLTTQNSWKHYARYSRYHPDNTERAVDLTLPEEVQGPPPARSFTQADKNHGAWGHSLACERAYGPSETLGTVIKTSITPKVRASPSPALAFSPTTHSPPASLALHAVETGRHAADCVRGDRQVHDVLSDVLHVVGGAGVLEARRRGNSMSAFRRTVPSRAPAAPLRQSVSVAGFCAGLLTPGASRAAQIQRGLWRR